MKRLLPFVLISLLFAGCAFEGKVYVAIHWYAHDVSYAPNSITTNIVNLPTTIDPLATPPAPTAIVPGAYYETLPGTRDFNADYGAGPIPFSFTLSTKESIMGIEDSFYDIICVPNQVPLVNPVPTF